MKPVRANKSKSAATRARRLHESSANNPESWSFSALLLLRSAGILGKNRFHSETEMDGMDGVVLVQAMLVGLAIESLLKAKWVNDGNRITGDDGRLAIPRAGSDHELVQLADAVSFRLSANERAALQCLSPFIRWAGRYPVPKTWEQMVGRDRPGRGRVSVRFISKSELRTAEAVAWRLAKEIPPLPDD